MTWITGIRDRVDRIGEGCGIHSLKTISLRDAAHGVIRLADEMTVDYSFGGFFSLPGGIQLDGGPSTGDALSVVGVSGSVSTTMSYVSQAISLGNATLQTQDNGAKNEIQFANFEPITINNAYLFDVDGILNIGAERFTVNANLFVKLGSITNIAGGLMIAPHGVALAAGQAIRGNGSIQASIAADVGSTVTAVCRHGQVLCGAFGGRLLQQVAPGIIGIAVAPEFCMTIGHVY